MSEQGEVFQYKKGGAKFLKMRKEFLIISDYDIVDALILRVFENELEQKRSWYESQNAHRQEKGQSPIKKMNFWIEMSWPRLIHKLHLDGHVSENTIKAHVRAVLKRGHLESRKNLKDPNRKPWQFQLNLALIQEQIDKMYDEPLVDDTSYLAPDNDESQGSKFDPSTSYPSNFQGSNNDESLDPQGQEVDPSLRSTGDQSLTPLIDRDSNSNIDSRDNGRDFANASHDAPTPLSLEERIEAAKQELEALQSLASSQQLSTPTTDLSPESVDKSAQTDNNTSVPPQASEQPPIANATRPAVVGEALPSEQKPARPARQRKPKEEKAKPSLSKEEETLRKEVLTWINTKRGYKLYGRATVKEIQSEYQCAHTLAHMLYVRLYEQNEEEGCTWEDLEYTHEYCSKRDNYWKLPDNKIRIGTFAVLQKFAVAMALKVQQPLINLEDRRNGVLKQTALEHGSRRSFLEEEKAREQSGIWGDLKKGTK